MYCGSNRLNPDVIAGNKVIGSRYQCLKKGIGQGLHMPVDLSYNNPYEPIDQRRFYCGNNPILPVEYDANGTLQQCFMKGVGVGRLQKARNQNIAPNIVPNIVPNINQNIVPNINQNIVPNINQIIIYVILYLSLNAVFIITLLYTKPSFILKDKKEIDWEKFYLYIALFSIILLIIFYLYYRFTINIAI